MDKNKLLKQAKTLHLHTEKDIIDQLIVEWNDFHEMFIHLKLIDVEGVKPMTRIDETPIFDLRDDVPQITYSKAAFLKNAPEIKDDYIVIKRVVGND